MRACDDARSLLQANHTQSALNCRSAPITECRSDRPLSLLICVSLKLLARPLGQLFTDDAEVVDLLQRSILGPVLSVRLGPRSDQGLRFCGP